jgi:hypothetical protein
MRERERVMQAVNLWNADEHGSRQMKTDKAKAIGVRGLRSGVSRTVHENIPSGSSVFIRRDPCSSVFPLEGSEAKK